MFLQPPEPFADVARPRRADSLDGLEVALRGPDDRFQSVQVGHDPFDYGRGDAWDVCQDAEAARRHRVVERVDVAREAQYLGESDSVGTIATGRQADLVVLRGDPSANIADIEKVETVFKDGVGYDSVKLIESVRGSVGWR